MTTSPRSIVRNNIRDKFARDEVVASMIVRLVRSVEIARIAKTTGFDSLYVDLEHNQFSLDTTSQICMAAISAGITPLVRVPANSPEYIARVLDGGALGIIAPHVHNAEEARKAVRYAKYPPVGERSSGGPMAALEYRSFPIAEANAAVNDATFVVAMMESKEGLANVEEIAAVEGLDMLLIGANDLCGEYGIPGKFDDPRIKDAVAKTIAAARKHGKHVGLGGLGSRQDLIAEFVKLGARYVSIGSDLNFMLDGCAEKAKAVLAMKT
jgi:4-hydroxy-2-oxoheptanedioate aldolase